MCCVERCQCQRRNSCCRCPPLQPPPEIATERGDAHLHVTGREWMIKLLYIDREAAASAGVYPANLKLCVWAVLMRPLLAPACPCSAHCRLTGSRGSRKRAIRGECVVAVKQYLQVRHVGCRVLVYWRVLVLWCCLQGRVWRCTWRRTWRCLDCDLAMHRDRGQRPLTHCLISILLCCVLICTR